MVVVYDVGLGIYIFIYVYNNTINIILNRNPMCIYSLGDSLVEITTNISNHNISQLMETGGFKENGITIHSSFC